MTSDYHLRQLIPLKFHLSSGIARYKFIVGYEVENPHAVTEVRSLVCVIASEHGPSTVLVSDETFPAELHAIRFLMGVDGETALFERYVAVHKAYESLVTNRDVDLSSIRHALAHPGESLTRADVVTSLRRRFGSTSVNLRDHQHKKEYYRCLGSMLVAIDQALANRLLGKRAA